MNSVEFQIISAVAQEKVTREITGLAQMYLRRRAELAARPAPKALVHHAKERKKEERAEDAAAAEVYKAVARRDRRCTVQMPESIVGPCAGPLQIDHQWGRGKEPTKAENCRRLCERHHRMKTDNKPSRLTWLYDFAEHCLELAGLGPEYMDQVDRAQRAAELEKLQHGRPT